MGLELPNLQRLIDDAAPGDYAPRVLPASWTDQGVWDNGMGQYHRFDQCRGLIAFLSLSEDRETGRWLHLSVSHSYGPPSWAQLMEVRRIFFGDREAVMVIPRDEDEVDISKKLPPGSRSPWHIWTRPWGI